MKKLFVGSLAWATTDETLAAHFATCGAVTSAKVITDRDSGRSKGFGFVEMEDVAGGQKAIQDLNGKEVSGRSIVVNQARPQENRR